MREAPSLALITALQDMGARIRVYDPQGMEQAKQALTDVAAFRKATLAAVPPKFTKQWGEGTWERIQAVK